MASFEPVDFYVKDTLPAHDPVAGVVVKVLSANGALVHGQQTTNADGKASFLLPSALHLQVRFYKFSYSFAQPQLFTPLEGGPNVFDTVAISVAPPVPADDRLCTAYGFFRDVTGAPQPNVEIHFIAKFNPVWLEGAAVVKERVIIRSDAKGYAQVNLIRNGQYDCTLQGEEDVVRRIDVPDAPNVNLPDLLFPVIYEVSTVPEGPFTLAVGEELEIELHVMSSAGVDLGKGIGDVRYRSTDHAIVGFNFTRTGMLLRGCAVGTAGVTLERANRSIVRIPDAGILGQPLLVTVTP